MNTDFMFFIRAGGISKALYPCESVSIRGSTESLRMKLFSLAKIFAVLPLFGACLASGATAAPAKPNIVFILADDLGWKDVGYMGSTFYRTPNIDRLAREGMQFTKAY